MNSLIFEDIEIENSVGFSFDLEHLDQFEMKNVSANNLNIENFITFYDIKESAKIDSLYFNESDISSYFIEIEGHDDASGITYTFQNILLESSSIYSFIYQSQDENIVIYFTLYNFSSLNNYFQSYS